MTVADRDPVALLDRRDSPSRAAVGEQPRTEFGKGGVDQDVEEVAVVEAGGLPPPGYWETRVKPGTVALVDVTSQSRMASS